MAGRLAWGLARAQRGQPVKNLGRLKWLGDCSYSLYVLHFPILALGGAWLMAWSPSGELPISQGWIFVGIGVATAMGYLAHLVVERPFVSRRS